MRHPATLALALALGLPAVHAQAQPRVIAQTNGWTAYDGTNERGVPVCVLETRDPNTGRHFLLRQAAGQQLPDLRLSRPSWNLGSSATRTVRIVIDRRVFTANATGAGQEMGWPAALDSFEAAFRRGRLMRVEFPGGPDAPWNLSLTGTNAVMGAFMGCVRMLAIQPGEPPAQSPIPPTPLSEPPPLAPPPSELLRPPAEAPARPGPGETPGLGTPDKPVPATPPSAPSAPPGTKQQGSKPEPAARL